ncbi:MAG: DUF4956 domain-containing protein [Bacteroidetes bacterium]|nr:DUF4956 domain-containing protein [Bacteroidota bacterium]
MNSVITFLMDNFSGFSPKNIPSFIFSLVICAVLSYLLGKIYAKYGNSLSNRRSFARNFLLLALTTMFIITVVKSSLALSLGLVGALSIVRFRAAIKEPEELTYLFLNIAIGLGCGAGLSLLTIIAFIGFYVFIRFSNRKQDELEEQSLYLNISSAGNGAVHIPAVVAVLEKNCNFLKLKRTDESPDRFELSFLIGLENIDALQKIKEEIRVLYPNAVVSLLDSSRDF